MKSSALSGGSFRKGFRAFNRSRIVSAAIEALESRRLLSAPYLISAEIYSQETYPDIEENTSFTLQLTIGDPDDSPISSVDVYWADGTSIDTYYDGVDLFNDPNTLTATVWVTHSFQDDSGHQPDDQYLLTITMHDDQSEHAEDFFGVHVTNVPPGASGFNLSNGNEGGAFGVRNRAQFTYMSDASPIDAYDLNMSIASSPGFLAGSYGSSSGAGEGYEDYSFDDNGSATLYGQLYDKDGGVSPVYSATGLVASVAPYGTLNVSEPDANGSVTASLDGLWDPSVADSNAGLRLAFATDFDSLPTTYMGTGTQSGNSRVFTEAEMTGATGIWVRVFDKDSAYRTYSRGICDMSAAVAGTNQINATWTDNVFGETGWRVQWSDDGSFGTGHVWYVNLAANTDHYELTNLPEGSRFWLRARAYDVWGNGNESIYSPKMAQTTLLALPTNVITTRVAPHAAEITWTDNSTQEFGYNVYRSTSPSGPYQLVGVLNLNVSSFSDPRLTDNLTYYYCIEAFNYDVSSLLTSPQSLQMPLTAPLNIRASTLNNVNDEVMLTWDISETNHTGYIVKAFDLGVDVNSATPIATASVLGNVNSHSFTGLSGIHQFTISSEAGSTTATSDPVENRTEPSASLTAPYNGSGSGSTLGVGVTATWTPSTAEDTFGDGISVDGRFYGNGTVTLELTGLPRHTYAAVHMSLNIYSEYPEYGSVLTATADGTALKVHRDVATLPIFHPNYGVWYVGPGEDDTPTPNAFEHSSSDMTVTMEMSNLYPAYYWGIGGAWVETYLPFVSISGPGSISEASASPATFTITRSGTGTQISEDLEVGIKPSGTATPGTDYQQVGNTVTIPAGSNSATFSIQPIDDGDIEPHETAIFEVVPSENYSWTDATAEPPAPPPKVQETIVDDDILVVIAAGMGDEKSSDKHVPKDNASVQQIKDAIIFQGIKPGNILMASSSWPGLIPFTHVTGQQLEWVNDRIAERVNQGGGRTVKVALIGYSWGGGLIHDVTLPNQADVFFTAYIDAIQHGANGNDHPENAEIRMPHESPYHLSFFQSIQSFLEVPNIHGNATEGNDPLRNIDLDLTGNYNHWSIVQEWAVRTRIAAQLVHERDQ